MEFTTQKIAEDLWAIEQKGVRSFLLTGRAQMYYECIEG